VFTRIRLLGLRERGLAKGDEMTSTLYSGALIVSRGAAATPMVPTDIVVQAGVIQRVGPAGTLTLDHFQPGNSNTP